VLSLGLSNLMRNRPLNVYLSHDLRELQNNLQRGPGITTLIARSLQFLSESARPVYKAPCWTTAGSKMRYVLFVSSGVVGN
jgi:hypothetical protein